MATDNYRPRFDVGKYDAEGIWIPLAFEDVDIYNVTQAALIETVTSDAYGCVEPGEYDSGADDAAAGDVIELQHATYIGTARMTLETTAALALSRNSLRTYVAENLAATETPERAEIWATDDNEPAKEPFLLGSAIVDSSPALIPYSSPAVKDLTLYLVPVSTTSEKAFADPTQHSTTTLTVPGSSIRSLADFYADATTTDVAIETLYAYELPINTLATDGDKLSLEYGGIFAANTNTKRLVAELFGLQFLDESYTDNNANWELEVTAMRESNTVVRLHGTVTVDGQACQVAYSRVTGLDLDSTAYNLALLGRTSDLAGDLTAKVGYILFIPAAPAATEYLIFLDDYITLNGDRLAFNP